MNIHFFQFGFKYGTEIFIPYSVGILWAYAKTFKSIEENYINKGFIFDRDNPEKIVASLENPDIVAFSAYLWNWELSLETARLIKNKFPNCLVIFGGHHVPDDMDEFFEKYPFINIAVHGEGEMTFKEILEEHINNKNYSTIDGVSYNDGNNLPYKRREYVSDINIFPSPYLTGVFDELIKLPYTFQPIFETNRGCPYTCAYCDWGSQYCKSLRLFEENRIYNEIEWFAEHKMKFVFGADSNFGIFPRDMEIAKKLAELKRNTGYPEKFRVSFTKNSDERILEIAKTLNKEKLDKGISLSVQSMDSKTLDIIKRKNIQINNLSSLIKKYHKENIPTYTELILGLPGETYESFKEGINELLRAGLHDSIIVYLCTLLPNSELNNKRFKELNKIKTAKTQIFLHHSTPDNMGIAEYDNIVIGTKDLSTEEWKKQFIFSWIIQCCHILNLTQVIALYLNVVYDIEYSEFYEKLLLFAEKNPQTVIGKEFTWINDKIKDVLDGSSWGTVLNDFADVTWPVEEASYLKIGEHLDRFFVEIKLFLDQFDIEYVDDLVLYQRSMVVKWKNGGNKEIKVSLPLHSFYTSQLIGESVPLILGKYIVRIVDNFNFNGDKKRYAKEIVWWGRKGGKFIYQNITEHETK